MILAIDIGNTNITCGVFYNDKLLYKTSIASKNVENNSYYVFFENIRKNYKISYVYIISVVNKLDNKIENILKEIFNKPIKIITTDFDLGIKIDLRIPSQLGTDRLINAYYGKKLYKNNFVIVDFGTATTFDVVDINGNFVGGLICPGLNISLKALNVFTSKLPLIHISEISNVIGKTTEEAILNGVVLGHAKMVDGIIFELDKTLNTKLKTIATGGYSNLIAKYTETNFDLIDENLTLKSLNELHTLFNRNVVLSWIKWYNSRNKVKEERRKDERI